MENEFRETRGYGFLEEEMVEKHFADIHFNLLSGRHMGMMEDYSLFAVIDDYYTDLKDFYERLYRLNLVKATYDMDTWYYLGFFDDGHGKLSDPSRFKILTPFQTITGLMLFDMYYTGYFQKNKIVTWAEIRQVILEGDHWENLQRILFGTIRDSYSDTEWTAAERKFRDATYRFEKLGWVSRKGNQSEGLNFEIRSSIFRLADIYGKELNDIDKFVQYLKKEETI